MMSKKEPRTVSIYLRPEMEAELVSRGNNRNHIIHRDLDRLYTLYRRAVKEVPLTYAEACLLVDVLNGALMDANSAHLLWAEIEDGCRLDKIDQRWDIDGKALVEMLRSLSAFHCMALIDAAERFWNLPDEERDLQNVRELFHVVD